MIRFRLITVGFGKFCKSCIEGFGLAAIPGDFRSISDPGMGSREHCAADESPEVERLTGQPFNRHGGLHVFHLPYEIIAAINSGKANRRRRPIPMARWKTSPASAMSGAT